MKNSKIKRGLCIIVSFLLIITLFCSCSFTKQTADTSSGEDAGKTDEAVVSLLSQTDATALKTGAASIKLSGTSAEITGSGAKAEDGIVTITSGGTYNLSGTMTDGRIIVDAKGEDVTLVLTNVSITSSVSSPIYIYNSSSTVIYLEDGTTNVLTDASNYSYSDSYSSQADEEPNACLYSKSDLIIAGSGALKINANFNNGITGKDTLQIENASVTVNAKNHGINGKDYLTVKNANISVTSAGDSVRSTNDTDTSLGYIIIANSNLKLTSGEDAVQAQTTLTISGSDIEITSGSGSSAEQSDGSVSKKGLKAGSDIKLEGGTYSINSSDDAVHSDTNVTVYSGEYSISSGDDGIHANNALVISGGNVNISDCYEGLEGNTIDISGGEIHITSSDDGINASGGADQSGLAGNFGQDSFSSGSDAYIKISGGKVYVNASGDGVDANGSIYISGGETYVSGPTNNGNGALDYDGEGVVTGGIFIATGSSGMAMNFTNGSTQGCILLNFNSSTSDKAVLTDSSGNVLVEFTPEKSYNSIVVSCPEITTGNSYTLRAGSQSSTVTMSSLIYGNSNGMMGGFGGQGGPGGQGGFGNNP